MMRQHKLFTAIYIAGTALAISFTMVLFILYYIKLRQSTPNITARALWYSTTYL